MYSPGGSAGAKLVAGDLRADEGISFPIQAIIPHPNFDAINNDYDIAILESAIPIVGPNIFPVTIAFSGQFLRDGIQYTVSGWGANIPQGPDSPLLQKAYV